ncbi:E2/E3 hybrid ubiquitin-protein ligase UBE2O [Grifola frondosa]|uniref:E2/E3 hybrid ubiquitin-protein ligase UBE2O n=1 Tax=Grifola frondosa TaxID=5627 RepID=A0A1C7MTC7_GRIFR|nr:E2/E3 hybrid ubiquitin-protein ligase UBE2O [Grifola frondosa]
MSATNYKRTAAKFYQEDIVQRKDDPNAFAVVLRCWHDAEELPPAAEVVDPLMRPLEPGEVGVSYFRRTYREILSEDKLNLIDRMYHPGDLLKRSVDDMRSGVVTNIYVKGRLAHAISGVPVPGWRDTSEVENAIDIDMGDYVVYNDWVGQVVEMFDEAVVDLGNGTLVRLPELSARLSIGEKGPDIIPTPGGGVQSLLGFIIGTARPSTADTVVAVKHTVLAVAWLAINQTLTPEEAQTRSRPPRFWYGPDLGKLTMLRRRAEQALRMWDRVILKDQVGLPITRHGREGEPHGTLEVRTLVIQETQTNVDVLWQDGTRETIDAKNSVPYVNPDEYDCWPGDHVLWKTEDAKRVAIVQSVNASDRTAQIRLVDTGTIELASVLELDPHGSGDWSAVAPTNDGLGVRRGDFVFIHREGTTNGVEPPTVPKIGEVEAWVREPPLIMNGSLDGWRREMADIGNAIAEHRGKDPSTEEGTIKRAQKNDHSLNWFGEVVDLRLDGTVEVVLPDSTTVVLPLQRLTRLIDGLDQIEDLLEDEEADESMDEDEEQDQVWEMDDEGRWVERDSADADDWESTDEEDSMDVDDEGDWSPSAPTVLPPHEIDTPMMSVSRSETPHGDEPHLLQALPAESSLRPHLPDVPKDAIEVDDVVVTVEDGEDDNSSPWQRFEILPSAPADHAFFTSPPAQPSRSFIARLTREYKALSSSLPESILVRTFEDRTDLLRCLIIGPENTPYQDAPFVIDWMLDSNFPQTPPIAHFLSWTNGNGRVNPNLYEEGKVCLSILGTWAGEKSESWSASRSSLLQAFVSIQGLVLVKEPWFCEPAYEKLRGTEDGIVNSRLYSEKAYVLSRGFVRRALEIPLGGLESEINWFYYTNGKLKKVLNDARALIEKSTTTKEDSEADHDLAVPRLSGGGIITLERTLVKLQTLLDSRP